MPLFEYIQKLILMQKDFCIAKTNPDTGKPSAWLLINEISEPIQSFSHRQELKNELILEIDCASLEESQKFYDSIKSKLQASLKSYSAWTTHSKSIHIHIFFDKEISDAERELLVDSIFLPEEKKQFDSNFWKTESRHLIALEEAVHYKSQKPKELIESFGEEVNLFPKEIMAKAKALSKLTFKAKVCPYKLGDCLIMLEAMKRKFPEGKRNLILAKNFVALNPSPEEVQQLSKAQENLKTSEIEGWFYTKTFNKEFNCVEVSKYAQEIGLEGLCENCQMPDYKEWHTQPTIVPFIGAEFDGLFENTHQHLPLYEDIAHSIALQGKEYYTLKKAICYFDYSIHQKPETVKIGVARADNRLHLLIMAGVGKGKGSIKNHIKRVRKTNVGDVMEVAGYIHPEQLIGKTAYAGRGDKQKLVEKEGYLRAKVLLSDECQNMINEDLPLWGDVQRIKRKAMDVYGNNEIEKKLIDIKLSDTLAYLPDTRFIDFMHPTRLKPTFFDTGSFRRYLALYLPPSNEIDVYDTVKGMLEETQSEEVLKNALEQKNVSIDDMFVTEEGKEELIDWVVRWNLWALTHEHPQVKRFAQLTAYSIKEQFIKMATILHKAKGKIEWDKATTDQACFDTINFLIETLKTITQFGTDISTSELWQGADVEEITCMEYLWQNGATSFGTSNISIAKFTDFISNTFGVTDRPARARFAKLKKRGFINSMHTAHNSKVWLLITPKYAEIFCSKSPTEYNKNSLLLKMKTLKEQGLL